MPNSSKEDLRQKIAELQEQLAQVAEDQKRSAAIARKNSNKLNLLEAMLEIVPVGVVVANNEGRIIMGNKAVEEFVRHPVVHSENVDDYGGWVSFHADGTRVQSHEYPLSRVIRDGLEHSVLDVHYQRGDKSRFWMRIVGRPVRDPEGNRIGATVALIDIDRERQLSAQQEVLIAELNHRVKNAFSVVKSIVSQTLRTEDVPQELRSKIDDRLYAYSDAHGKLVGTSWDHAELAEIAEDIVGKIAGKRAIIDGPSIDLPARQALALSMAFYELVTNAVKHGSLSSSEGVVKLTWNATDSDTSRTLQINWVEQDGPPVAAPAEKGFGSFIIDRALAMETSGTVDIGFDSDGFRWQLNMPLRRGGGNDD